MPMTDPGRSARAPLPIACNFVAWTAVCTTDPTTTEEIPFTEFRGGSIIVPEGSSTALITFYGSDLPRTGGIDVAGANHMVPQALGACQDGAGNAVTLSVAAGDSYPIPVACYGYAYLYPVVNNAGNLRFCLKG